MMPKEEKPWALPGFATLSCRATASGYAAELERPPPEQIKAIDDAFAFLFKSLREAERKFQEGNDAGREGVIEAVETTTKFLRNFPDVVDGGLHIPLGKLEDALLSLDGGLVLPLLRPVKRGGRVNARKAPRHSR